MKHPVMHTIAAAAASLFLAAPSFAHVGYGSALFTGSGAYDPLANTVGAGTYGAASNFSATVSSNAGYLTGLDPNTLGNSHDIRARYFVLDQASQVSFTIIGLTNANGASILNPGFSLYSGVVPASSHDGVGDIGNVATYGPTASYLGSAPAFASWSPFAGVNGVRGGAAAGSAGNPTGLWGTFDANGDWTTGNNGQYTASNTSFSNPAPADGIGPYLGNLGVPKVATAHYLGISVADAAAGATFTDSLGNLQLVLGADGVVDNSVSWSGILGPGVYTLAIGGANQANYADLFNDVRSSSGGTNTSAMCGAVTCASLYTADRLARNLQISGFTVTAVPEADAWAMMLAGLGLVGLVARRRRPARIW
jgi:MYXO-CTERM domain-containing protein